MSDLRPEDSITGSSTDGLAEEIAGKVSRWENSRDVVYRTRWEEYRRMWRGEWSAQDRDRQSERSHAIMPAIATAVDSAVSEVEEAMFGQERWFDVASDDPNTEVDEGGPGRAMADRLLMDLESSKAPVAKCALLAAVYGTGIGKLTIKEADEFSGEVAVELVAIDPFEFVIDPAAESITEAEGVAHVFYLPTNVVLERQRQGIYAKVDPGSVDQSSRRVSELDRQNTDTNSVRIIEYQGLIPAKYLANVNDGRKKLTWEEDKPVEALVTIANENVVLRAVENPLTNKDRGFVAFQWNTIPGQFWGRGVVEMGYWAQKVLDGEVRARIDALAFSTHPMMAVNAAMVPRNADFTVRPGRNIFLNGSPSESLQPINFPPPDPQTYQQGQEMQRFVEMSTGQLQAATPFGANGRNETASGMSMMLGASIRRTRKTLANIERQFMRPFIKKAAARFQQFDVRYQDGGTFDFRVQGALGMMAREFEQMQLSQLLNAIPPGAPQFALLHAVVDNMSITNKQGILRLLDLLTAQALEPEEPQRDLGGEARMIGAQTRQQEVEHQGQVDAARLQLEQQKLQLQAMDAQRNHERNIMQLSVDAERVESEDMARTSKSILDLAKAEAEELGKQLETYRQGVTEIRQEQSVGAEPGVDLSAVYAELEEIKSKMNEAAPEGLSADDIAPIQIERNSEGLVTSVNGRQVSRDDNGLIAGLN